MADDAPAAPHPLRDQVTLLLVNGASVEAVETFCMSRGVDALQARELVADSRKRITVSADYARDEQIGMAVKRLNDVYKKSTTDKDYRVALAAQKELNRLLGLYAGSQADAAAADPAAGSRDQLQLVSDYLKPLQLIDAAYPVEEHARVAAEILRANDLARL